MRKLRITARMLAKAGACERQRALFRQTFPRGVTITDDQEANFEVVVRALDAGLHVGWLTRELDSAHWYTGPMCLATGTPDPAPRWPLRGGERALFAYSRHGFTPFEAGGAEFEVAGCLADAVGAYCVRSRFVWDTFWGMPS